MAHNHDAETSVVRNSDGVEANVRDSDGHSVTWQLRRTDANDVEVRKFFANESDREEVGSPIVLQEERALDNYARNVVLSDPESDLRDCRNYWV